MNVKKILKPNFLSLTIFLIIGILDIYLFKEKVCAAGLFFAFCYNTYGFPFVFLVTGDVDAGLGHLKTLPLGHNFSKLDKNLFNFISLLIDILLVYVIAQVLSLFLTKLIAYIKQRLKK